MVSAGSEITHGISKGNADGPRAQGLFKRDLLYCQNSAAFPMSSHDWKRKNQRTVGKLVKVYLAPISLHQLRTTSYT